MYAFKDPHQSLTLSLCYPIQNVKFIIKIISVWRGRNTSRSTRTAEREGAPPQPREGRCRTPPDVRARARPVVLPPARDGETGRHRDTRDFTLSELCLCARCRVFCLLGAVGTPAPAGLALCPTSLCSASCSWGRLLKICKTWKAGKEFSKSHAALRFQS